MPTEDPIQELTAEMRMLRDELVETRMAVFGTPNNRESGLIHRFGSLEGKLDKVVFTILTANILGAGLGAAVVHFAA